MLIDSCCTVGQNGDFEPSVEELIRQMDRADVDKAVIHSPDIGYAWENEKYNDFIVSCAGNYRDRLIPSATINPWRPDALEVLRRGLGSGAKILSFSPEIQGFNVSGRKLDPVFEEVAKNRISTPIYIHTGHYSFSTVAQVFLLARRYLKLNFILGHSGATDYGTDVVSVVSHSENIYFESSFARPKGFVGKVDTLGPEKAIMGSGFPYNDLKFEWSEMLRLLPVEHRDRVCGGNLVKLLETTDP